MRKNKKFESIFLLTSLSVSAIANTINDVTTFADTSKVSKNVKKEIASSLDKIKNQSASQQQAQWNSAAKNYLIAQGYDAQNLSDQDLQKKTVKVFVNLKEQSAVNKTNTPEADGTSQSIKGIQKAEEKVLDSHAGIVSQVEELTGNKVINDYGYLVNGFSIDAKVSDLEAIYQLDGVASVDPASTYHLLDTAANQLSQIDSVWQNRELKGEGTVVAVIDSGVDYEHKDFKLTDPTKVKISKTDAENKIKALGRGEWKSDKVPFAYNYSDGDSQDGAVKDSSGVMHGQHVAGIIGANGDNANNVDSIKGVAPEAQILDLKVFPNIYSNVDTDAVIMAIQDAVTLGADVINMSLGREAGSTDASFGNAEMAAVEQAAKAGVIPVISAGNSGVVSSQNGFSTTSTYSNIDEAIIGSPSVTPSALAVASAENQTMVTKAYDISLNLAKTGKEEYANQNDVDVDDLKGLVYFGANGFDKTINSGQLVVLPDNATNDKNNADAYNNPVATGMPGRGFAGDFKDAKGNDLNVSGKIVVISRGINNFSEKQSAALSAGAKAVIIVNNKPGLDSLSFTSVDIPTMEVSPETWKIISQQLEKYGSNITLNFKNFADKTIANPDAGKISSFSSYGLTPSLDFKPEISGVGGNVWSTTNATGTDDGGYQNMSGTSMAAPFVAGSMALLVENYRNLGVDLKGLDLVNTAKLAVINTAKPVFDSAHNSYFSPRQQGSGLIQVDNAIANLVTVKDKNGLGTVALKEVGDKTEFTLTFTNNGKQDASYQFNDYGGVLHEAQDDSGLKYDEYLKNASITTNQNQFTVPANSSLDVTFTLDVTGSKANQFVEGFLGFTPVNSESGLVDLNVPYAGFYGDYANLPVFDQPAWHKDQNGDYDSIFGGQFFYDYDSSIPSGLDLGLNELNSLYSSGTFSGNIADLAKYIDPSHVAFSPNGDDDWDAVIPNIYLLRNVSSLNIDILDSKGNVVRELNKDNGYTKTWSTEDGSQVNYITVSSTWDGKISDPATGQTKVAPDGTYTYRVTATPDYPDAKPQTLDLSVIVDTTKPVIKNLGLQKDSNGDVYVTGSATDATSGFSDLTYMSFSINGVLSAYDLTDLTPEDRIGLGDKTQATTKIDPSNFKIKLNAKQAAAVKNGANDVQASIFDNAHNFSASQEKVSLGQADDMNNGLIVYNVSNYEEETDVTSPYYDPKNKTYSIQGYFPRDFYISSDGKNFTKVNVDEIGSFIANVPVSDETKKLYFTLDPNLQRPIQEFNFAFNLVPTITLDKEASGLDDDNTRVVDYDENEDGTVTFKGTYSDDSFDVSLQSYNENNDSDWVDQTSKVVKDPAAHTWSATITPETGTNQYNIFAIKKGGINGQTLIPSQPELAVVYKYDDTYLRWDNIADEGTSYVTSSGDDDFNKEANTYTVRGKLDPNDAKDLVIYGYSQDPNDPRNKPVVNADGSFTYDVPLGLATNADGTSFNDTSVSNNNLKIKYDFSQKLTDGTFATNTSMFALYVDSQDPSVNFNIGDQWSTSDDGTSYDVYTNQPTFNLQGTANDNLDGYSLRINSDVVLRTAGAAWDNSFLVENMASADFDHQFALDTSKDKTDNTFNVTVVDKMGNKVTKTIRVHYSVAKAASPIVAQDITTPTNKSVNVSAKVANPDDILSYSLDGTTFVPYLSDVSLPSNGTVYFKETDKFGNDSEIVKHDVTNIYKAVASQAKVVSDKQVADSNKHQLQLGLNDDISDLEKSITSIEYSLDNGKTWKQYTGALELDAPVNLQYRSKDTAGNAGEVQNYVIEKHTITPVKITASLDSYKLEVGKTAKITTNITPTYASNDQLSFSSSDNNVVDVDLNGKVTAKNPGKATITITDKLAGVFDTLTITVLSDVNDFTSSFVLPKTILNTNGSSSATGNLDSWLSNKNSSTTSANGQSLISVTTKDKTQANTPAVLATTNSNQSNKELPKTGENTELINELELAGDLAFFLLVLFILAGYKKNKLKQFSSLTLSFIAFNLYSPALSNLAENIGKLESPTVSLNKQLAKKSFGPNLVDAKAVGFVGGIKDLTDNKANLLSLDYSSTIVEVGNQSDEVKTAAQSVLTQIIGTLNYGMTVVDNHPQSYSQLLTPEQIDTLIEQFRQELSQETSADGVYSLQTEFFSNGGPVDLLVKKTVASQNDPVNLRNKALASFNDYINSPSFDSIDRATKDQWVADLTSTLSTLDSQSDIAKALNDARTKASDVLQALQHDKNVASLAEYKENKIKQLSKILDSSNLSDQQKTELLNQATSAINAVTLNVYDDFDQAKVDVDTAYNDAIDQINKALFENQYPITIDKNTIPDENLRNEILYQMQLGNDGVPTNKLTYDFAGQFTSLTLKKSLNIENYEGLQYFFNLTNLDISGSDVQDWSPLSKLPKLQSITADILGNDVTDIDVSDFPALTSLQISGNHSDGNDILSGSTAVKSVKTNANLDQLILYNLPNLDTVNTSLSTELTYLSASKLPELTNLDLSQNDNLVSLYAYNDENLSKLDVSNLYQLETLSLFGDALTSEGFEIGNIGYNLRTLNLNNNSGLNELPNDLYNLQSLAISGTAISDVSNTLKQAGSNLLNFTASDIPELTSVDLSNNKNLQSIALSNDSLTELNLQVTDENGNKIPLMPNLSVAILSGNQLSQLDFSNYQSLSFVQADNNQLTDLLVNGDTNLSVLTASNNKLVNIDLADNIYLSGYDLSGNNLTTLDLTTNIAINHQFGNSTYQTTDSKMYEVDGQYYVNLTDVVGKDNIKFVDVPGAGYAGNYQIIDNNDWEYNTVTGIAKWVGTGTPSQIQYLFSAGSSQFMPVIVDLNNDSNRTFNLSFDVVDTNAGSIDADQQTVQLGSPANSIPKPVAKAGFVFDHFENSHGITIDPNISKPNQDETYYAIFANADAENKPVREAEDTQVISVVVNDDNTVTIIGNTNLATNLIFDQNENPVTVDENGNFTYTVSADDNKESLTFTTWNYTQTRSKDKTITWENPFPASKPTETPTDDKPVVPVYENRSINVTDLETQTFTHTTHFVDQNGQKAGEDLVEKVVYTRSKTIDQDGNIVYGNWVDANGKTLTTDSNWEQTKVVEKKNNDEITNQNSIPNEENKESTTNASKTNENLELGTTTNKKAVELPKTGRTQQLSFNIAFIALAFTIFIESTKEKKTKKNK